MEARAAKLERYKLPTGLSEYAYSDNTVIHPAHSSDLLGGEESGVETRWKRQKEVGVGGFGTVWLEKNEGGELRAVKCLPTRIFRIDFLREVDAMAELRDVGVRILH